MASTAPSGELAVVASAVSALQRRTGFPVAFGGLERGGAVHVTAIAGARGQSLSGLVVQAGRGLGGRTLLERRPRLTLDYRTARGITHDYDRAVLGEGITTLLAVPVLVAGSPRGVLYCGTRTEASGGDVVSRPAFQVAEELARRLTAEDDGPGRPADADDARTGTGAAPARPTGDALPPSVREELRESYADLRGIAADVADPALRARLLRLEERIRAVATTGAASEPGARLSPRETDVLACVALGATNAEIARRLSLREATVKSYLGSAMAKLEVSTRLAAVARARGAGIIP
jgi:LuxR family transcriptional regulator, regulator of acetate metabolism